MVRIVFIMIQIKNKNKPKIHSNRYDKVVISNEICR